MAKFIDQFGQPLTSESLAEPQTARLTHLPRQLAGHPARGITPARLNTILESAELGDLTAQHELFKDMEERDGHVFSELSKRKRAVIKLNWDVAPPRNASKAEQNLTAYVKELLQDIPEFEDLQFDALDGIAHGFSALELEWQRIGADWTIGSATHRPQSWFQMDPETRNELRLRDNTVDGQPLRPFGWMLHVHRSMSGYTARAGLARVLVWPYLFKHFSVGDLAEFLDIYGLPLRVGKFPGNATEAEKATLFRAVAGIGHNAAGIIPASMAIEFEAAAQGSEKPFQAMIEWCEKTQSKAITGSTLGMDSARGGLGEGLSNVQNEIRLDIRDSDCKQLAGNITRNLIYPLLAINKGWSDIRRCPRFVFDTLEAEDLKTYADSLPKLVAVGMRIPAHWAHEKLRIPQPVDNEDVLQAAAKPAPAPADPADDAADAANKSVKPAKASKAQLTALTAEQGEQGDQPQAFPDQDAIDGALADLDPSLQPQVQAWLAPALQALEKANTAEAALSVLANNNPLVADTVLVEAIARAMFIAELVGAGSAAQELSE